MPKRVLIVGRLIASPILQGASYQLSILTQNGSGPRSCRVIAPTWALASHDTCLPGDLLCIEGRVSQATVYADRLHPLPPHTATAPTRGSGYAAKLRWQAERHSGWEIETEHSGFACAEDAAIFGLGCGPRAARALILRAGGTLLLRRADDTTVRIKPSSARIWRQVANDVGRKTTDDGFAAIDLSLVALAAELGHDCHFHALDCFVTGPGAEVIDVSLGGAGEGAARVRLTPVQGCSQNSPNAAAR